MKMKKILAVLLILLLILILVLIVRTVTYKFGKVPKNADDKELVKILTDASLPGGKTELTGKDIGISSLEKAKVQLYEFSMKEFSMTPTELSSKYRQVPLEELIKMLVALL